MPDVKSGIDQPGVTRLQQQIQVVKRIQSERSSKPRFGAGKTRYSAIVPSAEGVVGRRVSGSVDDSQ